MDLAAFDFDLPDERIALRPARPRDAARLLRVAGDGALSDHGVLDLPDLLQPGDLLVVNDTRTLHAALQGTRPARETGGGDGAPVAIEANLIARLSDHHWQALARPAKRLRAGDQVTFVGGLAAGVERVEEGGLVVLAFMLGGQALDAAIEAHGAAPLPPYIARKRAVDDEDRQDYQTLFAQNAGSVATPTAGLHFTPRLMDHLAARGVEVAHMTLHVGAGTFLPVKSDRVEDHAMHAETYVVPPEAAAAVNAAKAAGRRVVAVGTTSLRTLESVVDDAGQVRPGAGETALFITPGFQFRVADALMTNFHLPKSTLFMLVSAFSGLETMRAAYAHAIAARYRFFSYGDACLLERPAP